MSSTSLSTIYNNSNWVEFKKRINEFGAPDSPPPLIPPPLIYAKYKILTAITVFEKINGEDAFLNATKRIFQSELDQVITNIATAILLLQDTQQLKKRDKFVQFAEILMNKKLTLQEINTTNIEKPEVSGESTPEIEEKIKEVVTENRDKTNVKKLAKTIKDSLSIHSLLADLNKSEATLDKVSENEFINKIAKIKSDAGLTQSKFNDLLKSATDTSATVSPQVNILPPVILTPPVHIPPQVDLTPQVNPNPPRASLPRQSFLRKVFNTSIFVGVTGSAGYFLSSVVGASLFSATGIALVLTPPILALLYIAKLRRRRLN